MEYKTKEYYRNTIKEIARKTNMSEIYIAKKTIELCNQSEIIIFTAIIRANIT